MPLAGSGCRWGTFATGRLARWHAWHRFLQGLAARGDVWFAPMKAIATHVLNMVNTGAWTPRIDRPLFYSEPVLVR